MSMMNATRIFLRRNVVSRLTMIIWGTLASSVSNICTPKNANFLSSMGYTLLPNLALWQKIPSKSPVNCPSAQLALLCRCASGRLVPNTLILMPNWRTFFILAISSWAPLHPWMSTSLQSVVDFLRLEGKKSCHGNIVGVRYFMSMLWHASWFVIKFLWLHQIPSSLFSW